MKTLKFLSLMFIAFVFIMGCAGNYGKFKRQSESESKVTKRELIDNWSDYDIWLHYNSGPRLTIIVFDTKKDDKKILFRSSWPKVKDQEMWTEIVKANTTGDGDFRLVIYNNDWTSRVQEIWGPDNQLYGFIIYQQSAVAWVNVKLADENTIRLSWQRPAAEGGR